MMNLYLHELKSYKISTLIWTFSVTLVAVFFLSFYSSFVSDVDSFKKIIEELPEEFRIAFGLRLESFDSLIGYYSFIFGYVLLIGAIEAMNYGISIVSKEVSFKTADFLITKPVSRIQIITAKLLAILTSIIITNIIYLISVYYMSVSFDNTINKTNFLLISITLLFVQLIFMSIGVLISVVSKKIKSVISVSLSIVFSFYVIGMLGFVLGDKAISYLTPFKYFDIEYIIDHSYYEIQYIFISIFLIISSIVLSYFFFIKKDIHSV